MADKRLNGVWRTGGGEETWWTGLSAADFDAKNRDLFARNMRITDLETNGGFTAVWHPGTDGQVVWYGLSWPDFVRRNDECLHEGLRLVSLRVDDTRHAAVWRTGSGDQQILRTHSVDELLAADDQHFAAGLRIATMVQDVDQEAYYGVWRADLGTGAQFVHRGLSDAGFSAEDARQNAAGLRLVQITSIQGLTGIWRTGSDGCAWAYQEPYDDFVALENKHTSAGLRLVNLSVGFV
ncbi:hypothetical protein [Actinomycetospora sp. NBRC 106378]|jgi:hypothetical protein|uniref:hypothetical protein n=1 Tax=Actinomycetospora sp. NBRC 106378 TaxID=3032208 RepID=UPI002557BEE4|nr:hypothetical protein [Actinomycetospora sp. NBRC 106378]